MSIMRRPISDAQGLPGQRAVVKESGAGCVLIVREGGAAADGGFGKGPGAAIDVAEGIRRGAVAVPEQGKHVAHVIAPIGISVRDT